MASNKKIEEGLEHIRNAEKFLKTSLLKWRPDHDSAADEYQLAATCFKNGKSFKQCKDCLMKAADCYKQNRSLFHAAKCMEQALLICKDLGDLRDVPEIANRACTLYQQHGSPDSGAACLDKAAKLLEQTQPEQALRLFQRAADVVMLEDSPRQAAEFVSKVARILVKLQMYDEAATAIRREIGLHQQSESLGCVGRLAVALVLVQLKRDDYVAAEKAFKEWGNCCDVQEVQTLETLLQAFDEEDADAARRALNSPFIKHMDVEYSRLARDLQVPQGLGAAPAPRAAVRENAAPSYVSPNAQALSAQQQEDKPSAGGGGGGGTAAGDSVNNVEDDDEDGLC